MARCACASAPLAGHLRDPENIPHPACPPARFVVGVGASVDGREEAEARARAAVVRRLGSEIAVATDRMVELSRKDGVLSTDRTLRQRFKEEAKFRHGELVALVGEPALHDGQTYAFACLDRAIAAATLERELDRPLAAFDEAAGRAERAAGQGAHAPFAAAHREAAALAPGVLVLLGQLHAVLGAPPAAEAPFRERWKQLFVREQELRASVAVRLHVQGEELPIELRANVVEALRAAFVELGVPATVGDGAACTTADRGLYLVRVEAAAGCAWGALGHTCRPRLVARVQECSTQRLVFDAGLLPEGLRGTDGRDPERALRKALRDVTVARVAPELQRLLGGELPLGREVTRGE